MKKNHEKYFLLIIPAVIALIASVLIVSGKKKPNEEKPKTGNGEFIYDSVDPSMHYSENAVLYTGGAGVLHMIDTATGTNMVYCDRPNCTHDSEDCPAVMRGHGAAVLHNGHLYYVGNLENRDNLTVQYLYEMNANGENRRKVATINNVQDVRYVLFRDKYAIAAYRNHCEVDDHGQIVNDNKEEASIFVINLETYAVQMGDKVPGLLPDVAGIRYDDGAVYYMCSYFDDSDVTEDMINEAMENEFETFYHDHLLFRLYRYDIATGEKTLLKAFDHMAPPEFVDGDVYYRTSEGCFLFEYKSGESVKLPVAANARAFHKDQGALYYCCTDEKTGKSVYCRLENGQVTELIRVSKEESFVIMAMSGGSVYVGFMEGDNYCLGVVSLEDFNRGNYNVRKLMRE